MTEHKTFPGKTYCVTCAEGCTVSDSTGTLSMECEAGKQLHVTAPSDKLFTSASAIVREVFNLAPAKLKALGLLGGGAPTLPAGYLAAEFLESTGTQYIMTGFFPDDSSAIELDVKPVAAPNNMSIWLFANADAGRTESGRTFKAAANKGYLYFEFGDFKSDSSSNPAAPAFGKRRKMVLKNELCDTGLETRTFYKQIFKDRLVELSLFRNIRDATVTTLDIYSCCLTKNGKAERYFVPSLDAAGTPCMLDTVTKRPFYNSGTAPFSVGLSANQARRLSNLPETGGSMTILLPITIVSGSTVTDSAVNAALTTARANGWSITVQTYTEEKASAASTFGLRRIWVRKTQDENGMYTAQDGTRWQVDWCVTMYTPDDSTPDMHGYEMFRSVEAATEYWGLTPYVDPAWEEELLTETN